MLCYKIKSINCKDPYHQWRRSLHAKIKDLQEGAGENGLDTQTTQNSQRLTALAACLKRHIKIDARRIHKLFPTEPGHCWEKDASHKKGLKANSLKTLSKHAERLDSLDSSSSCLQDKCNLLFMAVEQNKQIIAVAN